MKKTLITIIIFFIITLGLFLSVSADIQPTGSGEIVSLSIVTYPEKTVYGAFEQLDTTGLSLAAAYKDGSERAVSGRDVRVLYRRDNCLRVGDDSVELSYGGKSVSLPVTVNRISYDLTPLQLTGFSTVYNGKHQSYASMMPRIVGLDGIPLTVNAVGGGINVGEYDISVDFSTDSADYLTPESKVVTMTIEPATAEIIWGNLSFTYDGKSKAPTAYFIDVNGTKVYPPVTGASTNAGTGYVARVSVTDANYRFINTTGTYEIKKADYDFSGVSWSKDRFTYDGRKKSISLSGLPAGISVIGYTGDRASDAGVYTAIAVLSWDERNYNPPPTLSHTWEICKADYDMSSVSFESATHVFDGEMHYPTLKGNMPIGADGIQLSYSFSAGASHVSDGVVSVIISFTTESKNYNIPVAYHSSVSIEPKGIEVTWGPLELSYNGEIQLPTAYSQDCAVKVSGGNTTVGEYVANATTDNSDYFIINDEVDYSIVKGENYWIDTPSDSVCYEGKDILLLGKSRFGNASYTFYSDKMGENEIPIPTSCGRYYARITVDETENYTGLISDVISFEIIEIVPVSFIVDIVKDNIRAFDRLMLDDIVCSVLNNDGSTQTIKSSLVAVIYENGDSFRKKDKSVTLKYGDFTLSIPVEVNYADYDMSSVEWIDTEQTYDGSAKHPVAIGLPTGVSIETYLGEDMINAGTYSVSVSLIYDSENYNRPIVPPCEFNISKAKVDPPKITAIYNGVQQTPVSDSDIYTLSYSGDFISVGVYTITAVLTDCDNYEFSDGEYKTDSASFEILPATLFLSISDTELRLFEKLKEAEYEIVGGSIFGDDVVNCIPYIEGNRLFLRSDNPNYRLDYIPGKIIRLPYPTFEGLLIILLALFAVLLALLIVLKLYRNRARLATVGAAIKCRWHNRGYKADPPTPERKRPEREIGGFSFESGNSASNDSEMLSKSEEKQSENEDIKLDKEIAEDIVELEISADKADSLITDSLARSLIKRDGEIIYSDGSRKAVMSIEDIGRAFLSGQRVDINRLKEKKLVPEDAAYLKVLGGGVLDKALSVYANEFSLCAVKMIALAGGQAIKTVTMKEKGKNEKE